MGRRDREDSLPGRLQGRQRDAAVLKGEIFLFWFFIDPDEEETKTLKKKKPPTKKSIKNIIIIQIKSRINGELIGWENIELISDRPFDTMVRRS